jgi:hypothetical protein
MPPFSPAEAAQEEPPRWSYDASLLLRRMALVQIDPAGLQEADPLLFRELQGICTLCRSKNRCIAGLGKPDDDNADRWHAYCPNAAALAALETEQNCGLAGAYGGGPERIVVTRLGTAILRTREKRHRLPCLE